MSNKVGRKVEIADQGLPDGFWRLREVYTNGYQIVVMGSPPQDDEVPEDSPIFHNCDAMGCSSVGSHVLAVIPVLQPTPELDWANENRVPVSPPINEA